MNLPESIRKAAEAAFAKHNECEVGQLPAIDCEIYCMGAEFLYQHLLSMGEEFDEKKARNEADRQHWEIEDTNIMKWEFQECFNNGARWQFSQSQAQIAALKARIADLENRLAIESYNHGDKP